MRGLLTTRTLILLALISVHVSALWLYAKHREQVEFIERFNTVQALIATQKNPPPPPASTSPTAPVATATQRTLAGGDSVGLAQTLLATQAAVAKPIIVASGLPSQSQVELLLAEAYAANGKRREALTHYRAALALGLWIAHEPYRELSLSDRAAAHAFAAELVTHRWDAIYPDAMFVLKDLSACALVLGQYQQANDYIERMRARLPDYLARVDPKRPPGIAAIEADLLTRQAFIALLLGEANTAQTRCSALIQRLPTTATLQRPCARLLAQLAPRAARQSLPTKMPAATEAFGQLSAADIEEQLLWDQVAQALTLANQIQ
jgi:tetratricopeptide (TPR) repeat protein